MNILIISGGKSSEKEISKISAREVKKALKANKHQIGFYDFKFGVELLKQKLPDYDIAFPVLHGEEGEGGELQQFLQKQGVKYVGGNSKGFKEGWFKIPFKKFCDKNGFTTARWKIVEAEADILKFGFPCVLKASAGGSSKEVAILKSPTQLKSKACQNLLRIDGLFIEEYIPGIEVTVGILDKKALPVIEIVPPKGKWFDYKNKYTDRTQELPFAPSLSPRMQQQIQKISLDIHQKLNLGPYSRIDFIVSNSSSHLKSGKLTPYVLEVNTIPGLTPQSLFPKAAQTAGISFENLIEQLVGLSFKKHLSC